MSFGYVEKGFSPSTEDLKKINKTRNPLADPGLLGLTSGANIAVALVYAFAPQSSYLLVSIACFVGAGLAMLFVYGLSNATRSGQSPLNLILIGAAVSFFFQAIADGIAIWFRISKDVSMWTSGGLMGVDWNILSITPVIGLALLLSLVFSGQLTVLSLGEETAISMGQRTNLIRTVLILLITLLAGSAVAIAGNLALIGLMIPHVVRKMVGQDYRKIIPLCITVGGTFMILADYIGRTVVSPFEIPVVAIVSVIGVPFYVTIARKGGIRAV